MEQDKTILYKEVPGCPSYRVGSDGSVWSFYTGSKRYPNHRWKRLATPLHGPLPKGRPVVNVGTGKETRHVYLGRLILEVFVGPAPTDKHECCHFPDRNPMNCNIDNLRWGTGKDNNLDQVLHGTRVMGEGHPNCRLSNADMEDIVKLKGFLSGAEISAIYPVSRSYIYQVWGHSSKRQKYTKC